ncbi:MAG: hypothetical protein EZS28_021775 [Streblomastix strix]|uniref:Uncharacterized protein n=1 Tax=Streblomastix strix TaxID=222440 RepID=A0A5J4VK43_9EUKA|nr:MAG: hypothetical protein EZS28_021775 [Streblomastix strix]
MKFRKFLKKFANSILGNQKRKQYINIRYKEMESNNSIDKDLFSHHFNNILRRFFSTTKRHGEIAIDVLNHVWKKEFPWIHPQFPLLPAVLEKISEKQIRTMIVAPLWPGQIKYANKVNKNLKYLLLGWSHEILKPGTSLLKKNLKLISGKIYCFLMDGRP